MSISEILEHTVAYISMSSSIKRDNDTAIIVIQKINIDVVFFTLIGRHMCDGRAYFYRSRIQ